MPPREEHTAMRMRGVLEPEYNRNSISEDFSLMRMFNKTETFETKECGFAWEYVSFRM